MKVHIKLTKCPFCEGPLTHNSHLCSNCGVLHIRNLTPNFFNDKKTALCGIEVKRG